MLIYSLRNILKSFNMDDFLNIENLNKEWIIMNIYNRDYNMDGLFPHWVKSAMDSLTSGNYLKNKFCILLLIISYKYTFIYCF